MQCAWAALLCLSGRYSDLLDYVGAFLKKHDSTTP